MTGMARAPPAVALLVCLTVAVIIPMAAGAEGRRLLLEYEGTGGESRPSRATEFGSDHGFTGMLEYLVLEERTGRASGVEGRKRKKPKKLNKYLLPLLVGFLLIKSVLLPLALKALAILSGKAVVLSLMSLILAAIVGLRGVAQSAAAHAHHLQPARSKIDRLAAEHYRRGDAVTDGDRYVEHEAAAVSAAPEDSDPYHAPSYPERRRSRR